MLRQSPSVATTTDGRIPKALAEARSVTLVKRRCDSSQASISCIGLDIRVILTQAK